MKRDKYTFLELMNDLDDELIQDAMNQEPARKKLFYHAGRRIACAAAVLLVGLCGMFHSQVATAINALTTRIAQFWNVEEDLTPYTNVLNTSQTRDGFTLTLNEVILSDNQLVIAADLDSEYPEQVLEFPGYIMIDGKECRVPDVSYETGGADTETEAGEDADGGQTVITCTLEDGVIPGRPVDIGLYLVACKSWEDAEKFIRMRGDIIPEDPKLQDIATVFKFEFRASGEEMAKTAVSRELNQEILADGGWTVKLKTITLNHIYSRITAELENNSAETEALRLPEEMVPEYYLEGEDSLGNDVYYWMYSAVSDDKKTWEAEFAAELRGDELPATESEWIDLRLFIWQDMGEPDTEPLNPDMGNAADAKQGNARKLSAKIYLGEKFRIYLK